MPGAPANKVKEAIRKYAIEHKNQKLNDTKKKIINVLEDKKLGHITN